jgi:hypothetical protein
MQPVLHHRMQGDEGEAAHEFLASLGSETPAKVR